MIKYLLTRAGERVSPRTVYNLNAAVNYVETGRWMRANGFTPARRLGRREELFDLIGAQVADREVLYLEFGVFQGAATRYWSHLLRNPASKLHGFDTFDGLPESWLPQRPAGHFSMSGELPRIDDPRVRFFKGLFEQTLPDYALPPHEALVLNFDADLYSSTSFVLNAIERAIAPGTYLYFDEFNHQFHELRAFDEFIQRTGMRFKLVGASRTLAHVCFQRIP